MQPGPAMDLALRQPAHEVQPPDLRPLLHPDHLGPPELALRKRAQAPQTTGRPSGGPHFNRRRWPSFHPAPTREGESDGVGPPPCYHLAPCPCRACAPPLVRRAAWGFSSSSRIFFHWGSGTGMNRGCGSVRETGRTTAGRSSAWPGAHGGAGWRVRACRVRRLGRPHRTRLKRNTRRNPCKILIRQPRNGPFGQSGCPDAKRLSRCRGRLLVIGVRREIALGTG